MDDPYKALGLGRDASAEEIRRAYLERARKHHPDLNPGDAKAEELFKQATAANDLLSDPEKRGKFDRGEIDADGHDRAPRSSYRDYADGADGHRYSHRGPDPEAWENEDFGDLFASMFSESRAGKGGGKKRGRDARYALRSSFLDAINGATHRLTLPDGKLLDVKIPAGTDDGQVLRLRGQGEPGRQGGAAGDALIEIQVAPHRFYRRHGQDIRLELPITLSEAVLGGFVEAPTPSGPVRLRVPAGSDTGTELRLRGRGVPAHGKFPAGDLYASLRVSLGPPDAALENFLKDWTPELAVNPRAAMEATP